MGDRLCMQEIPGKGNLTSIEIRPAHLYHFLQVNHIVDIRKHILQHTILMSRPHQAKDHFCSFLIVSDAVLLKGFFRLTIYNLMHLSQVLHGLLHIIHLHSLKQITKNLPYLSLSLFSGLLFGSLPLHFIDFPKGSSLRHEQFCDNRIHSIGYVSLHEIGNHSIGGDSSP